MLICRLIKMICGIGLWRILLFILFVVFTGRQGRISLGAGRCHGIPQSFLIYYIRCNMTTRIQLLQCYRGAVNCSRAPVQHLRVSFLHILSSTFAYCILKNVFEGIRTKFYFCILYFKKCFWGDSNPHHTSPLRTFHTTWPVINYWYYLKPFNIYSIKVWHPQQINSRSATAGRDGSMWLGVWACAYTKFLENFLFSSIIHQKLIFWQHDPHFSQIISLLAHTYYYISQFFLDNMNIIKNQM
jgi:hypothetical protein